VAQGINIRIHTFDFFSFQNYVPFSLIRHTLPIQTNLILFRIYWNMLDKIEFTLVVIDAVIVEKSKTLGPLFAVEV
jgi:hypothetical protein